MPSRPPLSSTSPSARFGPPVLAGLVLVGVVTALPGSPPRSEAPPGPLSEAWIDTSPALSGPAGAQVQKKPPCQPVIEVEWQGLCWVPHATRPPKCPPPLVEGAGQCLVRVIAPPPPNTSVRP